MVRLLYAAAVKDQWLNDFDAGAGTDDEPSAFQSSLTSQLQYTVVFVVNPKTGEVEAYIPWGLNFSLRASPPNYCPKPELFACGSSQKTAGFYR